MTDKSKSKKAVNRALEYPNSASFAVDLMDKTQPRSSEEKLQEILELADKNLKSYNEKQIKKAFYFTLDAYKEQLLPDGEPYSDKFFELAKILITDFKVDDIAVVCALLSESFEVETGFGLDIIKKEFGTTIAEIVEGFSKIKTIEENFIEHLSYLEQYRKILFSLFKDVRIILIKIAERLYTLRTLHLYSIDKQNRTAQEIMEVYVPFANRFGLRNVKWEMEDLSFKYINRDAYNEIKAKLDGTREERENYVKVFLEPIKERLTKDPFLKKIGLKWELSGRVKHIYSIFNKIHARQKPMEELYDLIAVRAMIDTDDANLCFYVYGIIASIYPPVPETFKDYINSSKQNGYQSIHTAVTGPGNKPVEVQIRTRSMHEIAEEGVAAHFKYKRGLVPATSVFENQNAQEWMDAVREIFESGDEENPKELLDSVKNNLFLKEIHVFSPKNEMLTFPLGSYPLDYAFSIHSELGYHCIGAKANSKIVPLDYKMQSGDQIEILTSAKQFPTKDWLRFVTTSKAKAALIKYFKNDDKINYHDGVQIWETAYKEKNLNINKKIFNEILSHFNYDNEKDFHIALGRHILPINDVLKFIRLRGKGETAVQETLVGNNIFSNPNADGFNINLFVKGTDRPGLLRDISNIIIKENDAMISSVSFDTFGSKFLGTLTVSLKNSEILNLLINKISKVQNVESIDWLEK